MHCSKCGIQNSDTAEFCSFCGAELTGLDAEAPIQQEDSRAACKKGLSRNSKIVAGSLLVIVALLVAAGFAMSLISGGSQSGGNSIDLYLDQANNTAQSQLDVPAGVNLSASGGDIFSNLSEQTTLAQSSGSNANQVQNAVPTPTPVVFPGNTTNGNVTPTPNTNNTGNGTSTNDTSTSPANKTSDSDNQAGGNNTSSSNETAGTLAATVANTKILLSRVNSSDAA